MFCIINIIFLHSSCSFHSGNLTRFYICKCIPMAEVCATVKVMLAEENKECVCMRKCVCGPSKRQTMKRSTFDSRVGKKGSV